MIIRAVASHPEGDEGGLSRETIAMFLSRGGIIHWSDLSGIFVSSSYARLHRRRSRRTPEERRFAHARAADDRIIAAAGWPLLTMPVGIATIIGITFNWRNSRKPSGIPRIGITDSHV